MILFKTNARLRADIAEFEHLLREAETALLDLRKRWIKETVRAANLESDVRVRHATIQQLTLDLQIAIQLADGRAVTIGYLGAENARLEKRLEPFTRVRARDSAGHFVKDGECVG